MLQEVQISNWQGYSCVYMFVTRLSDICQTLTVSQKPIPRPPADETRSTWPSGWLECPSAPVIDRSVGQSSSSDPLSAGSGYTPGISGRASPATYRYGNIFKDNLFPWEDWSDDRRWFITMVISQETVLTSSAPRSHWILLGGRNPCHWF